MGRMQSQEKLDREAKVSIMITNITIFEPVVSAVCIVGGPRHRGPMS